LSEAVQALFLKPPLAGACRNVVRDFLYGCWCNGRRIGGTQMPPLNDLYAATHARGDGVETVLLDAGSEPRRYSELAGQRFAGVEAVAVLSSTHSFKQDVECLRSIKAANPAVRTIVYGAHPTFMPQYCLREESIDFIVLREPEETIRCLLHALAHGETVEDLEGIGYRTNTGEPRINAGRPLLDLDTLALPDRTLLPRDVVYFNPVVKRMPYTTMQTSRGCPGRCIYCTAPTFYGNKYRFRSVALVLEELRRVRQLGYREVFFRDETFTAHRRRTVEICEGMLAGRLDLTWIANARVDTVDRELLTLLKHAGCHLLKFGVETGDAGVLHAYGKGTSAEQAEEALRVAREVGLATHAHIIFGGPGETPETVDRTIAFIKRCAPTTASFGIVTPYPGTELFEKVARVRPEIADGSAADLEHLHTQGFFNEAICGLTSGELSQAVVRAYRQFYLRPAYLLRRLCSRRSWRELGIQALGGLNVMSFALTGRK